MSGAAGARPIDDFSEWLKAFSQPGVLTELVALAACVGLALGITAALRRSVGRHTDSRSVWFGSRLVDGVLSDPLPVGAATDARTVLAMGFDAPMPYRIDGPSRLLAQVTSAMTNNLMHARLAAAELVGMRLLRVFPRLNRRIGLFETDAMPYLVQEGRLAAEQQLPALIRLMERPPQLLAA